MEIAAGETALSSKTATLKAIASPVMTVAVVAMMVAAATKLTDSTHVSGAFGSLAFLLATMVAIVYRAVNPIGWNLVLSALGYRTSMTGCIRLWLIAESRRWLPGGIWGYASRATRAAELGVPVSVASASLLIELLVTVAASAIISLIGVLFHYNHLAETLKQTGLEVLEYRVQILAAGVTITFVSLIIFQMRATLTRKVAGLMERIKLLAVVTLNWTKIGAAVGYMIVMAVINGTIGLCLLPLVDSTSSVPAVAVIAATSAAWIIGFLAIFAPGGLFVREAAMATLLVPWIPYESGIALAILSRLTQLVAEAICIFPLIWPRCRFFRRFVIISFSDRKR